MRVFINFSSVNFQPRLFWIIIAFAAVTIYPVEAFAEALTLGEIICSIKHNAGVTPYILSVVAYISGAFMIVNGVLLLVKHSNNPNDSQITKAIAHLVAGTMILSLPSFADIIQASLFKIGAINNTNPCTVAAPATGEQSLDTMMLNFVNNIREPMFLLCSTIGFATGMYMIFRGLLKASKIGTDARAGAPHTIVVNLVIGAILISLSTMLPIILETIFRDNSIATFPVINWTQITGGSTGATTAADNTVKAILRFVQVIGIISFLRGWLIIKTAVEGTGQATVPQGMTHIIGGAMAVNIGAMLKIIDTTFGTRIIN